MKKTFLTYLFAAFTLGSVVTSCSDDDDPIVCPVEATIFNSSNGLELTYSGESLLGKQVEFSPNANDVSKARLVLSGRNFAVEGMPFELPGSGVIPGEATTTLNIENMIINGDMVTFEGVDETESRKITYKGSAHKSSLKLDLNVVMAPDTLAGKTFNVVPNVADKSTPLCIDWVSSGTFPLFDTPDYRIHDLLALVHIFPVIPVDEKNKITIGEALATVLQSVTFLPDGNIQASYNETLKKDSIWKTSPINLATYVVKSENKLLLFINPEQIVALEAQASRAGVADILPPLISMLNKYMVEGIPLSYEFKDGKFVVLLDKDVLLPILQIVKPLLQNQEVVKNLLDMISKAAGPLGPLVGMVLPPIFEAFPNVIDKTTEIYVGVNFLSAESVNR